MIVCKFGGTSTTTKDSLENILKISKNKNRKIFVFSAFGKLYESDKKITDMLIDYSEKEKHEKQILLKNIKQKFLILLTLTKVNINLNKYFKKIEKLNDKNFIISRGEDLTAKIMSKFLNVKYIPAEKIIYFTNGEICEKSTKQKIEHFLKKYGRICTGGFYGFDRKKKKIELFSRGGGDTTGAIVSKLTDAKYYEVFTDVSGVKVINPKIIKESKTIKNISYDDMYKISSCDGKVLHQSVCQLLKNTNVKTKIINIFDLNSNITYIDNNDHKVSYISFKENDENVNIFVKNNKQKEVYACDKDSFEQYMRKIYRDLFGE